MLDSAVRGSLGSRLMSALRQAPRIGRRALVVVVSLVIAIGLIVVFSGVLTRSTDIELRVQEAQVQVEARELELAASVEEREFLETDAFVLWQARVHGFGHRNERRFVLPDDAPEPQPITPIGPLDTEQAMAPFEAWMDLLFGA